MKTLTLHLIRHGRTAANDEGKYVGVTDIALNMEGADDLERLQKSGIYPEIEQLYCSNLTRCMQSGILIYPDCAPIPVPNLAEYNFGKFEGKSGAELEDDPDYKAWIGGKIPAPPEGESNTDFTLRLAIGLRQVVEDMLNHSVTKAAVITHGGVIMTLLDACAVPRREKFEWMCESGHGYTLRITPSLYHSSGIVEVIDEI